MFDLETCIAYITNNMAKKISDIMNEKLMEQGITRVQWVALYYVGKYEMINQNELAEKMDLKHPSVARLINRMEREQLVERIKDANDRRITHLKLTKKGEEMRSQIVPICEQMSKTISKGISDEEIEIYQKVLRKLLQNMKNEF